MQGNTIADERFGVWMGGTVQHPAVSGNSSVGDGVGVVLKVSSNPKAN